VIHHDEEERDDDCHHEDPCPRISRHVDLWLPLWVRGVRCFPDVIQLGAERLCDRFRAKSYQQQTGLSSFASWLELN
jgi:hypothetical protein